MKDDEGSDEEEEMSFFISDVKYVRRMSGGVEINFKKEFFRVTDIISERPFKLVSSDVGEYDKITKAIQQEENE